MTSKSNDNGRAFEYACICVFKQEISVFRKVKLIDNSSLQASCDAYSKIDEELKSKLIKSAEATVKVIFDSEPLIIEDGSDELELMIQPDSAGESGDVRDILIIRRKLKWEIGLSLKHNHEAAKHPRLSLKLDFGKKWYNVSCSQEYWNSVYPIFDSLKEYKEKGLKWNEIGDKDSQIYVPLLESFSKEIKRAYDKDPLVPKKLVSYIIGKYDFYKVISKDSDKKVKIVPFNLRGELNHGGKSISPKILLAISQLPTEIALIKFKHNSKNTLEMYLDNGWQLNFRIHNASTKVETSLKFDVQIIGMPATIITIERVWS
jgi:hypothetical protein